MLYDILKGANLIELYHNMVQFAKDEKGKVRNGIPVR